MHHFVQSELFFTFERFSAYGASIRSLGTVALPVSRQVVLAFQSCTTNITHKPSLRRVTAEMLLQQMFVQIFGLAFWAPKHSGPIRAIRYPYLSRFRFDLRRRQCTSAGTRLFASLFLFFRFRFLFVFDALSRVFQKMMQGKRRWQMRQVIGHRRPGRGDALPRRRHAAGLSYFAVARVRIATVEVYATDAGEVLVDLKRAGSEMRAYHGEVHLLKYVARTERRSHF